MTYAETAKELGIRWRIGKYGIRFIQRDPTGWIYKLISFIPLDGWITDPKEVVREMWGMANGIKPVMFAPITADLEVDAGGNLRLPTNLS